MMQLSLPRMLKIVVLLTVFSGFSVSVNGKESTTIDMRDNWGIEPVHLRVTADGFMIEFRYQVVDTEKALVMSDRKDFPYLQAMKSNARLSVPYFPTVGFVKSNRRFIKQGKHYTAMFSNEGRHLLAGDKVKIQIRDEFSPVLTLQ